MCQLYIIFRKSIYHSAEYKNSPINEGKMNSVSDCNELLSTAGNNVVLRGIF